MAVVPEGHKNTVYDSRVSIWIQMEQQQNSWGDFLPVHFKGNFQYLC